MERKLSAIMFTDIVGFTSHMAQDEEKTLAIINKMREVLKPIVEEHKGIWIKEMGDGSISSFQSATMAVDAAMKIQIELRAVKEFQIRIGLHLGEIVHDNNDVLGEGVNIAARIEPQAETGGIYFSRAIYDSIHNKPKYVVEFVGSKSLKNVGRDIEIYAIQNEGFPKITRKEEAPKASEHEEVLDKMQENAKAPEAAKIVEKPKIVEEAKERHSEENEASEKPGSKLPIIIVAVIVILAAAYFGVSAMGGSSTADITPTFITQNDVILNNYIGKDVEDVKQQLEKFQKQGLIRFKSRAFKEKETKYYMYFVIKGKFVSAIYTKDGDSYIHLMKKTSQSTLGDGDILYLECDY